MTTADIATSRAERQNLVVHWISSHRDVLVVYGVVVSMILGGGLLTPQFLSSFNIQSVVAAAAPLALVATGQTAVVITGGIDLSVGSTMSLTAVVTSMAMNGSNGKLLPAVLLCIAIGVGVGLLNGVVVTGLRVEPIIATLGTMSILQGATFLRSMTPAGLSPPFLGSLVYENTGPIPKSTFVIAVAVLAGLLVLRFTRFGKHVYAIGSSEQAARLSGVHTVRVKIGAYVFCGILAALAGLMLQARLGQGDPLSGQTFMLTSVAVVAIGGTSLFGGRGGLVGTLGGVFILTMLANLLNLEGVQTYPQQLITGLLIIIVVALYSIGRVNLRRRTAAKERD